MTQLFDRNQLFFKNPKVRAITGSRLCCKQSSEMQKACHHPADILAENDISFNLAEGIAVVSMISTTSVVGPAGELLANWHASWLSRMERNVRERMSAFKITTHSGHLNKIINIRPVTAANKKNFWFSGNCQQFMWTQPAIVPAMSFVCLRPRGGWHVTALDEVRDVHRSARKTN